jgi:hypothetical protein
MAATAWPERADAEPNQDFGYLFMRACGPGPPNEMNCTLPVYIFGQQPMPADKDKAANIRCRSLDKNSARHDLETFDRNFY